MRHFYVRALVHQDDNHPWKNKITYDADGFARIPIGCVAIEFNDDVIVGGPDQAYNMSFAFVSPGDNFNYRIASRIARGRLSSGKHYIVHAGNFKIAVENHNGSSIFSDAQFKHKYLRYIDEQLFSTSARACMKKLDLDEKDKNKESKNENSH